MQHLETCLLIAEADRVLCHHVSPNFIFLLIVSRVSYNFFKSL